MRRILKFLGTYIALTAIVIVGALQLSSCDRMPWNYDTAKSDSVLVAEQVEAIINPQFTTVQDIIEFRQRTDEGFVVDSIFRALPESVLSNVAAVLIKKDGSVDKKSIVKEYKANKGVYDNLPPAPISKTEATKDTVDLSSTDLGTRQSDKKVISTSYTYRTDTVNGKPVKIQIKTEESYAD